MSETEYWSGRIKKCIFPKEITNMMDKLNYRAKHFGDSWDWLDYDEDEDKIIYIDSPTLEVVNGTLYDISGLKQYNPYGDIFQGTIIDEETIEITTTFYNGGCGLGEALEMIIDKLEKEESK